LIDWGTDFLDMPQVMRPASGRRRVSGEPVTRWEDFWAKCDVDHKIVEVHDWAGGGRLFPDKIEDFTILGRDLGFWIYLLQVTGLWAVDSSVNLLVVSLMPGICREVESPACRGGRRVYG
jgi:hypothetical protein